MALVLYPDAHALAVDEDPGSPLLSEETLGHVMDVARVLEVRSQRRSAACVAHSNTCVLACVYQARAGADAYRAVLASLPTPMQTALPSNT